VKEENEQIEAKTSIKEESEIIESKPEED